MKNIIDITAAIQQRDGNALQQIAMAQPMYQEPAVIPEEAIELFNDLFQQLKMTFPASMANIKSQEDFDELRRQWVMAFAENNIRSTVQINAGMAIARKQETPFLPSPGQFVSWCKDGSFKAYGLPNPEELYWLVMTYCKRKGGYDTPEEYPWCSDAEYWLVMALYDGQKSKGWDEAALRRACSRELLAMLKKIQTGEQVPARKARLPPPKRMDEITPAQRMYAEFKRRKAAGWFD